MIEQETRFGTAAAAVFDQLTVRSDEGRHLRRMALHNGPLRPRRIVFVEFGDLLEQLRASFVVKILARERFLWRTQAPKHIAAKPAESPWTEVGETAVGVG